MSNSSQTFGNSWLLPVLCRGAQVSLKTRNSSHVMKKQQCVWW